MAHVTTQMCQYAPFRGKEGTKVSVTMSMIRKEEEGVSLTAAGFYSVFRTQTESRATSAQYNIMHRQYKLGAL